MSRTERFRSIVANTDCGLNSGESDDVDRTAAYRDQALVFLLAYSGARSAELVAVSDDEERNGLRWRHVDLEAGTMQGFGKNRTREAAPILDDALRPLRRWKQLREPNENDTMFPRLDNAAKALDPTPSITTQSARDILADLCEWSDYEFEEPLKPHGARRGLGREIYREIHNWHRMYCDTNPSRRPMKGMLRKQLSARVTKQTISLAANNENRYTSIYGKTTTNTGK